MDCPNHLLLAPDLAQVLEFPIRGTTYEDVTEILIKEYVTKLDNYFSQVGIKQVGFNTFRLPRELVRNAYSHRTQKDSAIAFGVFLSPERAVVGCNDGGDYFKDQKIKFLWENKIPVASKGPQYDEAGQFVSGLNNGNRMIYGMTDEVFIDSETGTFFGMFDPRAYNLSGERLEEIIKGRVRPKAKL